nr:MAG TPA: hypothetical protein [Caudoviricetes sp.]
MFLFSFTGVRGMSHDRFIKRFTMTHARYQIFDFRHF